jgi:hypothetical protein
MYEYMYMCGFVPRGLNSTIFLLLQKTHSSAVHVRQRAESLLQTNHFDPAGIKEIADSVTNR